MAQVFAFPPRSIRRSVPQAVGFSMAVAVGLMLGGCKKKEMENPLLNPPVVEVAEVTQADVPVYHEWIGSLDGSSNAEIRARVSGYILTQKYKDGMPVAKGEVLFEIDPRPFQASLASAQASLAQAQAEEVRAQLEADKYTRTFASGAASEKDRDNAVQQYEAAKAKVKAEEASVEQAKLQLEFTTITAPFDGVASIATRNIGDLVGPGDPSPLTTVSTLDPIRVYFQVSEQTYLRASHRFGGRREEGLKIPVKMTLADGSLYPQDGHLVAVDREVQGTTGTIRIAAAFPNPGNRLRPGQFARVQVPTDLLKEAMLVPQQALEELQGSFQVAVVNADQTVSIRTVKTGPRHGAFWVITEGLKPGEKVVVEGVQKVAQGKKVEVKAAAAPKPSKPDEEPAPAAATPPAA